MAKKKFKRGPEELIDECWEQIENLKSLCAEFGRGIHSQYKNMSVILRLLLIGSSQYPGLLEHVIPSASFFPLRICPVRLRSGEMVAPAEIVVTNDQGGDSHFGAGGAMLYLGMSDGGVVLSRNGPVDGDVVWRTEIGKMFSSLGMRQSLTAWLESPFLRSDWSIKSFIKCVAHKDGGAHIDTSAQLRAMEGLGNIHRHLTERISRYVAGEIAIQLKQTYPTHRRTER